MINAKGTFTSREGFYLHAIINGDDYFGEAAPLQGFSEESFTDVDSFLRARSVEIEVYLTEGKLLQPDLNLNSLIDAYGRIRKVFASYPPPPSVYFALDAILFQYWTKNRIRSCPPVSLNALASSISEVERAVRSGFNTVKLKIGIDVHKELQLLSEIRRTWPDLNIRLDANQGFSLTQAQKVLPLYAQYNPEYMEEPTKTAGESLGLKSLTGITFAADESVRNQQDLSKILSYNIHDVIILKPMLCNGFYELLNMIKLAHGGDKKVILSTSLDTGLARRVYALLASFFLPAHTHGLATGFLLMDDVWSDDHLITRGCYHPELVFCKK
ncbi:MAG: hypothetical protein JJU41_01245 [Bacteroidetes bacterium]|nr:hypothetical protein [Bacteroidota bacterium]